MQLLITQFRYLAILNIWSIYLDYRLHWIKYLKKIRVGHFRV